MGEAPACGVGLLSRSRCSLMNVGSRGSSHLPLSLPSGPRLWPAEASNERNVEIRQDTQEPWATELEKAIPIRQATLERDKVRDVPGRLSLDSQPHSVGSVIPVGPWS